MSNKLEITASLAAAARKAFTSSVILCCAAASLSLGCHDAGLSSIAGKSNSPDKQESTESSSTTATDTDASADTPIWVNGSFLTCSWLEISDANDVTTSCRMVSSSGVAEPAGLELACSAQDAETGEVVGQTIPTTGLAFHVSLRAQQIARTRVTCQVSGHGTVTSKAQTLASALAGGDSAELLRCLEGDAAGSARACVVEAGISIGIEPAADDEGGAGPQIEQNEASPSTANCRNAAPSAIYNYDGAVTSRGNTSYTSGTAIDVWDTLDDYYGLTTGHVPDWSSDSLCDSTNWTDVTPSGGCAANAANCTYKDGTTTLLVTKLINSAATYSWSGAVEACGSLNYGGYTSGWRLPTQEELLRLYTSGIHSIKNANFISDASMKSSVWSSTSNSSDTSSAWGVILSTGVSSSLAKTTLTYALCVR